MNVQHRDRRRLTDAVSGCKSDARNRSENESSAWPRDNRGRCLDESPSVAREGAEPRELVPMSADSSQVIVTAGCTAHAVQVHHRDIPELNAHGESPKSAALNLAQDLAREFEGVADNYHRGMFRRVLGDVRAFIERIVLRNPVKATIVAGIRKSRLTDALRWPWREADSGRGASTPKRQHETSAEQIREAQESGEARGAVASNRERMVDIGRGNQQAGRQGQ
jgi:hypothetical protein